jgi:site-specific DNA-cytosine methylase
MGIFSAAETGAPHQRKRVFILSFRNDARLEGLLECGASQGRKAQAGHAGGRCDVWPSRPNEPQHAWEPPRIVGDGNSFDWGSPAKKRQHDAKAGQTSERKTKSTMGGNIDGSSSRMDYAKLCFTCDNRVDELRLLGNGVVPATAKLAFTELMKQIKKCKEVQG